MVEQSLRYCGSNPSWDHDLFRHSESCWTVCVGSYSCTALWTLLLLRYGYLYSNSNNSVTYFHWKILALAGIWTRDFPGTKPICYQLSYHAAKMLSWRTKIQSTVQLFLTLLHPIIFCLHVEVWLSNQPLVPLGYHQSFWVSASQWNVMPQIWLWVLGFVFISL